MLKPAYLVSGILAVAAGCSSGPRAQRVSDYDFAHGLNPGAEQIHKFPSPHPAARAARASTPTPPASQRAEEWISLNQWSRADHRGDLQRISSESLSVGLLTSLGEFVFQPGSRVALWNGLELYLGFEPRMMNGRLCLNRLDLEKNVEPLLSEFQPPASPDRVLVIDPGHGGQNLGATSVLDGTPEKTFTLDWAQRLQTLLATNGWKVFLTRTGDVDLPLSNRVEIAEAHRADLFISLHFNSAAPSEEQHGVETYCLTPEGMVSTLTRGYADDVTLAFPNNVFDAANWRYAVYLQRSLVELSGSDRGVRHARFLGVLRGQRRPAVLLEGGYLSNPDEAGRIADPAYRQQLAEAVARVLTGSGDSSERVPVAWWKK